MRSTIEILCDDGKLTLTAELEQQEPQIAEPGDMMPMGMGPMGSQLMGPRLEFVPARVVLTTPEGVTRTVDAFELMDALRRLLPPLEHHQRPLRPVGGKRASKSRGALRPINGGGGDT